MGNVGRIWGTWTYMGIVWGTKKAAMAVDLSLIGGVRGTYVYGGVLCVSLFCVCVCVCVWLCVCVHHGAPFTSVCLHAYVSFL